MKLDVVSWKLVCAIIFRGFSKLKHRHKHRHHIPDGFGDRLTPLDLANMPTLDVACFTEFLNVAIKRTKHVTLSPSPSV